MGFESQDVSLIICKRKRLLPGSFLLPGCASQAEPEHSLKPRPQQRGQACLGRPSCVVAERQTSLEA